MRFLWEIKLYQMAGGMRVVIKGGGRTVEGHGWTVEKAFSAAECQLVEKPPFVPFASGAALETRTDLWDPHGNSGMRHTEDSDVAGGETSVVPCRYHEKGCNCEQCKAPFAPFEDIAK